MRHPLFCAAIAATLSTPAALAGNFIDLRLASSVIQEELPSDIAAEVGFQEIESTGTGISIRGQGDLSPNLFVRGSYVSTSGDEVEVDGVDFDIDVDASVLRAGLGLQGTNATLRYYGALEFAKVEIEVEGDGDGENGYVLYGGLGDTGQNAFLWSVELGYIKAGDSDGALFAFDLGYRFNPHLALVIGYEGYAVEDDEGVEDLLAHGSLGIRYQF